MLARLAGLLEEILAVHFQRREDRRNVDCASCRAALKGDRRGETGSASHRPNKQEPPCGASRTGVLVSHATKTKP
ncbi:hypothetical protein, partial [Achromobacter xylosoxidans]|uniref:hypothetical protein n=1 Tax=Alcaligenes xylosoxydans xylosoxydans TaxID=85698 RepID=UPI0038FC75C3